MAGVFETSDCNDCGFGVQGVEDGFEKNEIDTPIDKGFDLFGVGSSHLVEVHGSVSRVFDAR